MRRDVSGQRPEGVHNPPAELMPLLLDACRNQEFVRVLDSDQAVRVEEPGRDELLLQALRAPLLVAFNLCGLVLRVESSASPEDNGPTDGAGGRGTASLRCSRRPSRTSRSATSAPSVRLRPCAVDSRPSNPNAWSVEAPLTCFQSFGGPQFFRDTKRVKLLTQLRMMGFRSRGLVDEHGELLAAALYSAPLPAV